MSTLGQGDFELAVRQQPKYACVAIERKPIDPPPIVQLMVNPRKDPARTFLQNPYLILTARLIRKGDEDHHDEQTGPKESDLTGTLVSSLYSLKDTDNSQGGFFVFGDLSVRRVGTYRLAFILYELRLAEKECWLLSRTVSDPFVVYATKTFPGLAESTFLTRSFSDQGVRLRLRKDSRTVSTKKRTISQADHIRASQGIHGYLPHDASHDLSPNGHSPHHLRRLSSLHDQAQLDRSRSYYSESPQMRAGEYTSSPYGYTPYDDQKPHKRARMDATSPDSPHASGGSGYETDPAAYHTYGHHHHSGPRTVPDPLGSIYPLASTITSSSSYTTIPAQPAALPPMPSPYASMPRLDTTHLPPHSPAGAGPGSATSTFSPGTVGSGGARRSPTSGPGGGGYPYPTAAHQGGHGGQQAMFAAAAAVSQGTSLPYHPAVAAAHGHPHHPGAAANGLGIVGVGVGVGGLDLQDRP
ncbi:velvet factor-domain-containing protein [Corynascus similis CBS 632.67]